LATTAQELDGVQRALDKDMDAVKAYCER